MRVFGRRVSCAKTAGLIEMPFVGRGWFMWVKGTMWWKGLRMGRIHSQPRGITRRRCGFLPFALYTLFSLWKQQSVWRHCSVDCMIDRTYWGAAFWRPEYSKPGSQSTKSCSSKLLLVRPTTSNKLTFDFDRLTFPELLHAGFTSPAENVWCFDSARCFVSVIPALNDSTTKRSYS